jgi:hypothetical protein
MSDKDCRSQLKKTKFQKSNSESEQAMMAYLEVVVDDDDDV